MERLFGWTGKIRRVNVSDGSVSDSETLGYAPRFIGGKGIASRLYWELMSNNIGAFDPENHLFVMNGPLCGTRTPAASRWIVAGKSPLAFPEQYAFGNLGGHLGAALKWAGLDGLDITGSSKQPVVLVVGPSGKCLLEDASGLWGKDAFETIASLQKVYGEAAPVAAIGKAGELKVRFSNVIGSGGVSATKGYGAVMGSKNLKAIVVNAPKGTVPVARPETLKEINREITALWKGESSGRYWWDVDYMLQGVNRVGNSFCYGCPGICQRGIYQHENGERGHRIMCLSALFYGRKESAKTGGMGEATFHATQLANRQGLCAQELSFLIDWVPEAMQEGVIDPAETGLDPDKLGTAEWIDTLVRLIINRQGTGDLLAEGSRRAARELKVEPLLEGRVSKTGFQTHEHSPRMYLSAAPLYATEPIYPNSQLHEVGLTGTKWMEWLSMGEAMSFLTTEKLRNVAKRFWGDERAAEFDSPEKMGEAAVIMQNRGYAKENMIFCDWFWPIHYSGNSETGAGDPSLEARVFSAVTGVEMDEEGYLRSGERCVNQCRAIYLREGRRGRVDDVLEEFNFTRPMGNEFDHYAIINPEYKMPGSEGKLFTATTVNREYFKQVMDDYYRVRGWDRETGLFRKETLIVLNLEDLMTPLQEKGAWDGTG
jgi:aldehyde:ferredoxin oxidoreductase